MDFEPKIFPFCHFLVFYPWIHGAVEINYIQDIAPDFYHACPCVEPGPTATPLSEQKAGTLADCWGACFLDDACFSFSYLVSNKNLVCFLGPIFGTLGYFKAFS